MMQAFRNAATPLVTIVAIAFFAWLVLDLSGLSGGTGPLSTTSVGRINGQSVDARAFQEAVSQLNQSRQSQSEGPLGIAEQSQIRDQVWEQFIERRLLAEEYKRWGVSVTSQEVAEAIRVAPPQEFQSLPDFQTEGQFDPTKYERWLASAVGQSYIPLLEEDYRNQILQAKLARHVVGPLYVSDAELWERFRDQNETATVGLVAFGPEVVTIEAVPVTPTEIEEFYRSRREELRREQSVWLSFVRLERRILASDSTAALARAQAIREELAGGVPFDEVARRESSDTVSGNQGGNLGEWARGTFDPDFETAAWALPLNTVSPPVLTQFGYHLIEITARSTDKATGRHILIPIEITGEHRDALDLRADSLEFLAADQLDPTALDTAARLLGLPIESAGPVVKGQTAGVQPDAAIWAFQAEVGEHSPIIEAPEAYYVFRVDSTRSAGIPALAEVRQEIGARIQNEKRKNEARKLGEDLVARARQEGLEAAAGALALDYARLGPFSRLTAPPIGPRATGVALALPVGEVSGVLETPNGFVVLESASKAPVDSAAFVAQLDQYRQAALASRRQLYLQQYLAALRADARIVDERSRLYRTEAQIEAEAAALPPQPTP